MRKRMGKHNLLIVRCENEALNLLVVKVAAAEAEIVELVGS